MLNWDLDLLPRLEELPKELASPQTKDAFYSADNSLRNSPALSFLSESGTNTLDTADLDEEEAMHKALVETRPIPPAGFICFNCHEPGHYPKFCPNRDPKTALTPYQGSSVTIGDFHCKNCRNKWTSHRSLANELQKCKKCGTAVAPYRQVPLHPKPHGPAKPWVHDTLRARNEGAGAPSPYPSPPISPMMEGFFNFVPNPLHQEYLRHQMEQWNAYQNMMQSVFTPFTLEELQVDVFIRIQIGGRSREKEKREAPARVATRSTSTSTATSTSSRRRPRRRQQNQNQTRLVKKMVQSASTAEPSSGRSSAASLTQERVPSSATGVEDEEEQGMCGLTDLVSHCLSSASGKSSASRSSSPTRGSKEETQPLLRASLFPNVPPTIRFYVKGTKVTKPTRKIAFRLAWCHNSLLPIVMRQSLATSHFTVVDENAFWIGYWGRHLKSSAYKYMHPYQKINHFPGAFHLGRKDRLSQHVERKRMAWGEDTFGLMPITYVLPADIAPMKAYLAESPEHHVIVKPPASARGTGITVTRRLTEIPKKTAVIAQQYVDRPLTINGAKLDLRLYAYVSSLSPLRVYLYEEGLVRFASVPYSCASATASNRYVHLTNYSVNKFAEADGARDSPVPKWTLTQLWKHLTEEKGVDTDRLRENIEDLVVKTIIATEKPIREHTLRNVRQVFACHELFGFDVLLDADLRPWLLEVNISPSLHSGTKLDVSVKAPLAKDVLNLAGIHIPPDDDDTPEAKRLTIDYSARPGHNEDYEQTIEQRDKENFYEMAYEEQGLLDSVLEHLTPEDVRMLVDFEDELDRAGGFQLLFPRASSARALLPLFDEPHYPNLLLSRWQEEFGFCAEDRELGRARLAALCQEKYHQFRGAYRRRLPSVPAPRGVPKTPPTAVKVRDISSVPIPSVPSPPRSVDSSECSSTSDSPPLSGVL